MLSKDNNIIESCAKLTIDLDALYKNASHLLKTTGGGLMAVVKNDAYHFGLEKAVETFYQAGVRSFATTSLRDCILIRNLHEDVDIFMLNPCRDFDILRDYSITATLASLDFLRENKENMYGISYHLEWAGQMRRSGCRSKEEIIETINLAQQSNIQLDGIWTHFSWADEFDKEKSYEKEKIAWLDILDESKKIHDFRVIHAQNSASLQRDGLLDGHSHARVGISLYGCPPYKDADISNNHHALRLSGYIISINDLEIGQSIGYCSSFIAGEKSKIGVINIGYGDGLLRKRVLGQDVLIGHRRYPLVGMMMSHTLVLLNNDDMGVKVGHEAVFYGDDIPVYEYTFKGIGANSEQISPLNFDSLEIIYLPVKIDKD